MQNEAKVSYWGLSLRGMLQALPFSGIQSLNYRPPQTPKVKPEMQNARLQAAAGAETEVPHSLKILQHHISHPCMPHHYVV